ncbi:hypothetical protein P9112_010467 [Eukaryota sp. TZLM1-RC]
MLITCPWRFDDGKMDGKNENTWTDEGDVDAHECIQQLERRIDEHAQDAANIATQPICPPSPSRPGVSPVADWSDAEVALSEFCSSQSLGEQTGGVSLCSEHNRDR